VTLTDAAAFSPPLLLLLHLLMGESGTSQGKITLISVFLSMSLYICMCVCVCMCFNYLCCSCMCMLGRQCLMLDVYLNEVSFIYKNIVTLNIGHINLEKGIDVRI